MSCRKSPAYDFGILAKVHDAGDNNATAFDCVEDSIRETMNQKPPIWLVKHWSNLWSYS